VAVGKPGVVTHAGWLNCKYQWAGTVDSALNKQHAGTVCPSQCYINASWETKVREEPKLPTDGRTDRQTCIAVFLNIRDMQSVQRTLSKKLKSVRILGLPRNTVGSSAVILLICG
jgi:hypothetical protein